MLLGQLGTSMQYADIESDLVDHSRFYYDGLVAAGVDGTSYSWADAHCYLLVAMHETIQLLC